MTFTRRMLLTLLLLSGAAACTPVAPWQRASLADRRMQWQRSPDRAALRTHVLAVREGVPAGESGGGGACGCE